jgi:hypothetical protein
MFTKKANRNSILINQKQRGNEHTKSKIKRNEHSMSNRLLHYTRKLNRNKAYPSGTQSWTRRVSGPTPASPRSSPPLAIASSRWRAQWRNERLRRKGVGAEQVLLEAVEKVSTRDGRAAAQVVASQVVAAQVVPAGARMVVGAADRCVAVWREQG